MGENRGDIFDILKLAFYGSGISRDDHEYIQRVAEEQDKFHARVQQIENLAFEKSRIGESVTNLILLVKKEGVDVTPEETTAFNRKLSFRARRSAGNSAFDRKLPFKTLTLRSKVEGQEPEDYVYQVQEEGKTATLSFYLSGDTKKVIVHVRRGKVSDQIQDISVEEHHKRGLIVDSQHSDTGSIKKARELFREPDFMMSCYQNGLAEKVVVNKDTPILTEKEITATVRTSENKIVEEISIPVPVMPTENKLVLVPTSTGKETPTPVPSKKDTSLNKPVAISRNTTGGVSSSYSLSIVIKPTAVDNNKGK